MSRTSFSLLACVLLHSSLLCMEKQSLLCTNDHSGNRLNTPLSQQNQVPLTYQSFPASQQHANILQQRHPDHAPLLSQDTRAENIALIRSIGAHNTATKLFGVASLLFAANAAKDLVSLTLWGLQPQYPLTPLIPPSHLAPLQPCHQVCHLAGCCGVNCDPGSCVTICDGQWDCTPYTPLPRLTNLGITNLSTCGINGLGAIVTGFLAFRSSIKSVDAEKELKALLIRLDAVTEGQPIKLPAPLGTVNPMQEVLDKVVAQSMEQDDQVALDSKRQELIKLIKSTGSNDAKVTLSLLLAAIFGLNLVKDVALGHIWGQDTTYPLTPLLVHNKSTPLMPCKQVCWAANCPEACVPVCEAQCVEEKIIPNALGYMSLGTSIASAVGLCASVLSAFYYGSTQKELDTLIKHLDELINASEETV